jgi:hypothetical protein
MLSKFRMLLTALSVIVLLNACSSGKDAVLLKFNLQKGKVYTYAMEMDMENSMQGQKMNSDMNFDYDIEVLDNANGVVTLKNTYKRITMSMNMPNMNVDIDTDEPAKDTAVDMMTNPLGMMGNMFRSMKGKSFTMKVDAEGKVIEVAGIDQLADEMVKSMNLPEEAKGMMQQSFKSQFNEESIKQTFSQAFSIFPNKPVKVGDTWNKDVSMGGMTAATMKTTYKVKEIGDNDVTLDVNSTVEMGENKGTQTGSMKVDQKTGLVTDGDLEQKFTGAMASTVKVKIKGKEK